MSTRNGSHWQGREVVIVEAARTPIGRGHPTKGWYRDVHPNELLGAAYRAVIERAGIDPELVDDVAAGCLTQIGEQSTNIARNAWLQAGLPATTPATTVDRQCGSAQQAVSFAAALIAAGVHDVMIGGGVEHMGRIPMGANVAHPDEFGTPFPPEQLAALKPAFKPDGTVTAGNASQISDGAAAVLLMAREKAEELGLQPRARIYDATTVGVDPVIMLTGPIPATRKLLERNAMTIDDLDLIEINEAFASVVCAWRRELGPDMDRVNVNGGAMALGHPLGSSGARLITTLLHELERSDGELGLVTMCTAGGTGTGTLLQRV
jgi:acetyl-CoA acetyltransferase